MGCGSLALELLGAEFQRITRSEEMIMPRHIRSVTARRSRRIAGSVKNARRALAPAASAQQVELFDGLRQAFQATPEIPETTERTLERYVWAIESLADYLEDIGADAVWIERIDALGSALEDLTKGELPLLLNPSQAQPKLHQ